MVVIYLKVRRGFCEVVVRAIFAAVACRTATRRTHGSGLDSEKTFTNARESTAKPSQQG